MPANAFTLKIGPNMLTFTEHAKHTSTNEFFACIMVEFFNLFLYVVDDLRFRFQLTCPL